METAAGCIDKQRKDEGGKPWAGNVSVTSDSELKPSVIEEIEAVKGVKRAFGRMEYGGLSFPLMFGPARLHWFPMKKTSSDGRKRN